MTPGNKALSQALTNIISDYNWNEIQYRSQVELIKATMSQDAVPRSGTLDEYRHYNTAMRTLDDVMQRILDQMFDGSDAESEAEFFQELPDVVQEYCKKRKKA